MSVLLREMEGFDAETKRTVVIGATNRKADLDPALLSRFDLIVTFGLPDAACRCDLGDLQGVPRCGKGGRVYGCCYGHRDACGRVSCALCKSSASRCTAGREGRGQERLLNVLVLQLRAVDGWCHPLACWCLRAGGRHLCGRKLWSPDHRPMQGQICG